MSDIDLALKFDKEARPNYYARCEAIARIIDPAAFLDDWVIEPPEAAELHRLKLDIMRAHAFKTASEVLKYLGVMSAPDWLDILTKLAEHRYGEA